MKKNLPEFKKDNARGSYSQVAEEKARWTHKEAGPGNLHGLWTPPMFPISKSLSLGPLQS